jgi:hypothetical protein
MDLQTEMMMESTSPRRFSVIEMRMSCPTLPTGGRGMLSGGTLNKAPENSKLTLSGCEASTLIFPFTLNLRSSWNSIKLLIVDDSKSINWLILVQSFPNKPFFFKNSVSYEVIRKEMWTVRPK